MDRVSPIAICPVVASDNTDGIQLRCVIWSRQS